MTLPVPASEPVVTHERQGADNLAELTHALAHQAQQSSVVFIYAPTSIVHHPAPTPSALPTPQAGSPGHAGIDIDATGYGGTYTPPVDVAPLPPVPERRNYAPLGFLVCGWSTIAGALATAVTGGDPAAIAATLGALAGSVVSFAAIEGGRP